MEDPPLAWGAMLVLIGAIGLFVVLGFFGLLPLEQIYVVMTTLVLAQALAVILAFVGGVVVGLFLAHRILDSRDFTPFERAVLEGQREIKEKLDGEE